MRTVAAQAVSAVLLLIVACQNPQDQTPAGGSTTKRTLINGTVARSDNGSFLPGAVVLETKSGARDTTDSNGAFSFTYDLTTGSSYSTTLIASRNLFTSDTAAVTITAGTNGNVAMVLGADSTSPITGGSSGAPASIVLVGTDAQTISIRGTGVNESALLTFEVRDSLGNPVLGGNGPVVKFSIVGRGQPSTTGGEYLYPTSAQINGTTGRVSTRLNSGTLPGVIQVQASTRNDSVVSAPARVTIASGLPDGNNASISKDKANIPGILYDNERVNISVFLGDRFQNPVAAGTAVYFTTTGGIIKSTGTTNEDGMASVQLISANPRPAGGLALITARTVGDTAYRKADSLITLQTWVVFSGSTQIVFPPTGFAIGDSGSADVVVRVMDQNGNPLVGGSTINFSLEGPGSGGLSITTPTDNTMEDTQDTLKTKFTVHLQDNTRGGVGGLVDLKVTVKSRNGDLVKAQTGFLSTTGGGSSLPGATSTPRSITLNSVSARTLSVRGTGANETSRLTFTVRDSLGNPVGNPLDPSQKAWVTFSINPVGGLGGTEYVYPAGDSTDLQGQVSVTFNAGTKSGVVQIVASTFVAGVGTISASAVPITIQGGLPDSTRFVTGIDKVNMPGLVKTGPLGSVHVQAADEFGNPVQPGTAIYFSTNIGTVVGSTTTSEVGDGSVQLLGGVQGATNGQGVVTVQTVEKSGLAIRRSVPFLFTGAPLITGAPGNGFTIPDSGFYDFSFRVADLNGNPLSAGAAVTVTKEGPGSADIDLTGDVGRVFPDTRDTNLTFFNVRAIDKTNGGAAGTVIFRVSVTGENGTTTYAFSGTQLVSGQPGSSGTGTGYASSIQLVQSSPSAPGPISVKGTGASETATFQFLVKDSSGNAIDLTHRATVTFTMFGNPGGGEFLSPASTQTDASGNVYTILNAGTKSGVVQIQASTTVGATTVKSAPIAYTIAGGLPDANAMSVWTSASNYAGLQSTGTALGQVFVQVGDQYGNPAQPSPLYFTTNSGLVTPSAISDLSGHASATLFGGPPYPAGGIDTVSVSTVGSNNLPILKQVILTYSGAPVITTLNAPTDTIAILDGGFFDLAYRVADANGNPLAAGNAVSVSVSSLGSAGGSILLSGDATFSTPDTRSTSTTSHVVRLRDSAPNSGTSGEFRITITSNGPNGSTSKTLVGLLGAPGQIISPSPNQKYPASISFIGVSSPDIFVSGVGALEQAVITYEVRDSSGTPLGANNKAYASFSLQFFPNSSASGGSSPFLLKSGDSTNEAGRLTVQVVSGTTAGVVQVTIQIMVAGNPVTASPVKITVHAGFPDQRHFTIAPKQYNFPGLGSVSFVEQNITVQVADKYSNPVQAGTAVYFHTLHGTMQTGASTDSRGFVTQTLNSAQPYPVGSDSISLGQGFSYVYAQTQGDAGVNIIDSIRLLWTGDPIVTLTGGTTPFAVADGGSSTPFTFEVKDFLGHPMSGGTSITVTAGDGQVDGDANVTLKDTQTGGAGVTDFTIIVSDASIGDIDPPKPTLVTVVVSHPVFGTYKKVIATGTID